MSLFWKSEKMRLYSLWRHEIPWVPRAPVRLCPNTGAPLIVQEAADCDSLPTSRSQAVRMNSNQRKLLRCPYPGCTGRTPGVTPEKLNATHASLKGRKWVRISKSFRSQSLPWQPWNPAPVPQAQQCWGSQGRGSQQMLPLPAIWPQNEALLQWRCLTGIIHPSV